MRKSQMDAMEVSRICKRLNDFAKKHYGSWEGLMKKIDVPRSSSDRWRGDKAHVPGTKVFVDIGRATNASLDWLLLGEGPELGREPADPEFAAVVAPIRAVLRQTEEATAEEFDFAWKSLMVGGNFGWWVGENPIFGMAVEGVRIRLKEELRVLRKLQRLQAMRDTTSLTLLATGLSEQLDRQGRIKDADTVRKLFREARLDVTLPAEILAPPDGSDSQGA